MDIFVAKSGGTLLYTSLSLSYSQLFPLRAEHKLTELEVSKSGG